MKKFALMMFLMAGPVEAGGIPYAVDFISQKPDAATATKVPYTANWAACCTAFTASTRATPFHFGLNKAKYLRFLVTWTAGSATASVRLLASRWVKDEATGTWSTVREQIGPEQTGADQDTVFAPRSRGHYELGPWWNKQVDAKVAWDLVVEFRGGTPTVFQAGIDGVLE